jgi:hypothetical protein
MEGLFLKVDTPANNTTRAMLPYWEQRVSPRFFEAIDRKKPVKVSIVRRAPEKQSSYYLDVPKYIRYVAII